jgi:hypothetical protein
MLMGLGFCFYYLFGTKNEEVSSLTSMVYTIFRNVQGLSTTRHYFQDYPVLFTVIGIAIMMFWFYLVLPVTISLLLDSFQNTVMEMGRIND